MFSVWYDALRRNSELVAMRVERLSEDLSSIERIAYLWRAMAERLQAWLELAGLRFGPLLPGLHTHKVSQLGL
jgi:hypothetical protein